MCGRSRFSVLARQWLNEHGYFENQAANSDDRNNENIHTDDNNDDEQNLHDNLDENSFPTVENLGPGSQCPILCPSKSMKTTKGSYEIAKMTWGLIPKYKSKGYFYSVQVSDFYKLFNKRIESLLYEGKDKNYFQNLVNQNRCIVVFDGFYEWKHIPAFSKKQPYYVHLKNEPLVMAAIYDEIKVEGKDSTIKTFSILTSEPSKKFSVIHNRQPVFLSEGQVEKWLDLNYPAQEILQELNKNHKLDNIHINSDLDFYEVTPKMSNIKYQGEDCSFPLKKATLSSFFKVSDNESDKQINKSSQIKYESNGGEIDGKIASISTSVNTIKREVGNSTSSPRKRSKKSDYAISSSIKNFFLPSPKKEN